MSGEEAQVATDERTESREHVVCREEELPPGAMKLVPIGKYGVGVFNVNGKYFAITNFCPHEGGPLCKGRLGGQTEVDSDVPGGAVLTRVGEFIFCPWHQWGFELATGTTSVKPEWSIRTYPVKVVNGEVVVTR